MAQEGDKSSRRLSLSQCTEAVKLDVSKYQLYRDEKQTLRNAWLRMTEAEGNAPVEIVLVHGEEATGKSAFVHSLRVPVEVSNGVFLTATFSNDNSNMPFSAISDAIVNLCSQLKDKMGVELFQAHVTQAMGEHVSTLTRYLPRLADVLQVGQDMKKVSRRRSSDSRSARALGKFEGQQSKQNLRSSEHGAVLTANARAAASLTRHLRNLLKILSQKSPPVLFLVEDLHLADTISLNFLVSVIAETDIRNILFVATCSDQAVSVGKLKEAVSDASRENLFLTEVFLKDITLHEVNQLVAAATQMPVTKIFDLGSIVHQKTGGNLYLVTQFLELLQEQNLLLYSLKTNGWVWDIARIESDTDVTENVADIIVKRIDNLPETARNFLKIASCLGSQFELALVALIVISERQMSVSQVNSPSKPIFGDSSGVQIEIDPSEVEKDFDYLYQTGLLEKGKQGFAKFSHEKVQQASYALIPEGPERDQLHLRIGKLLCDLHDDNSFDEEWMFFSAVDQFNKVSSCIKHEDDILAVIKLNLNAAELALHKSAFVVALMYLNAGINLIERSVCDYWNSHYRMCLDLYSTAAEMEQCVGNAEKCLVLVNEVFEHGLTVTDKFQAHVVQIQIFCSHGSLQEATYKALDVLKELGLQIPMKPHAWQIVRETQKTKRLLKGRSNDDLLSSPKLNDPKLLMIAEMLHLLSMYCHVWQESRFSSLVFMTSFRFSLENGISEYTPYSFASFAVILANAGEIREAFRYEELALQMMNSVSEQSKAEILLVLHSFLYHWKNPLRGSLDPLVQCYEMAMDSGSIDVALSSADAYAVVYTCAGLPLSHVASDMRRFKQQTVDYRLDTVQAVMASSLQFIMNLMGESRDPIVLTGEAMNQVTLLRDATASGNRVAVRAVYRYRLFLAAIFGDTTQALAMIDGMPTEDINCHFGHAREAFASGLACIARARKTQERRMVRRAKAHLNVLLTWTKDGNVNCHDMLLLLQAEMMSIEKNLDVAKVRKAYDTAISSSARSGYVHNAAIANEKAALFFEQQGDSFWFEHYMEKAHEKYTQWNAWGKVRQLEMRYPLLRDLQSQSGSDTVMSGSVQGRTRFKGQHRSKHEKMSFDKGSSEQVSYGRRRSVVSQRDRSVLSSTPSEMKPVRRVVSEHAGLRPSKGPEEHRGYQSQRRSSAPSVEAHLISDRCVAPHRRSTPTTLSGDDDALLARQESIQKLSNRKQRLSVGSLSSDTDAGISLESNAESTGSIDLDISFH